MGSTEGASSWGQTILRSLDCIVPNGVEESGCLLCENSPAVGRVQAVEGCCDNLVGDGRVWGSARGKQGRMWRGEGDRGSLSAGRNEEGREKNDPDVFDQSLEEDVIHQPQWGRLRKKQV